MDIQLLLLQPSLPHFTNSGNDVDDEGGGEHSDRRLLSGVVSLRRGELMVGAKSVGVSIALAISDDDGPILVECCCCCCC